MIRTLLNERRFTQKEIGRRFPNVGLSQGRISRLSQSGSDEGVSYEALMSLAMFLGRQKDAERALGHPHFPFENEELLSPALLEAIARNPNRQLGISAATTLWFAKGSELTPEQWNSYIDATENMSKPFEELGKRAHGTALEDSMKDHLDAHKSRRSRLSKGT